VRRACECLPSVRNAEGAGAVDGADAVRGATEAVGGETDAVAGVAGVGEAEGEAVAVFLLKENLGLDAVVGRRASSILSSWLIWISHWRWSYAGRRLVPSTRLFRSAAMSCAMDWTASVLPAALSSSSLA